MRTKALKIKECRHWKYVDIPLFVCKTIKEGVRNYQKVIKGSFRDATNHFGFLKYNPAVDLQIPKVFLFETKKHNKTYLFSRRIRNIR